MGLICISHKVFSAYDAEYSDKCYNGRKVTTFILEHKETAENYSKLYRNNQVPPQFLRTKVGDTLM